MRFPILLLVLTSLVDSAGAGDWPGWRGPTGQGVCSEKDLPLEWSAKTGKNVLWKAALPGSDGKLPQDQNQSSPVVYKGRVFVASSFWPAGRTTKDFPEHHLACYRARDGEKLWDAPIAHGPWSRANDLRGGYTAATPAVDDRGVFVVFGSSVIARVGLDGKSVWRKEIVPYDFDVAMASSPVLYRNTVLLQCDGMKNSRLVAFAAGTGEILWTQPRPKDSYCHSTPVLVRLADRPVLLVAANKRVQGVDPDNGKLLWWCEASGDTPSPVMGEGVVYCDNGRGGSGVAVEPGGTGDITKTHRRWKHDHVSGGFSSPLSVGDRLYRLTDPGVLRSWKWKTGADETDLRLPGVNTAASPFSTPDRRIYAASAGKTFVVKAGDQPKVLAINDLGDGSNASPAVSAGRIYLRGRRFLWCIGAP